MLNTNITSHKELAKYDTTPILELTKHDTTPIKVEEQKEDVTDTRPRTKSSHSAKRMSKSILMAKTKYPPIPRRANHLQFATVDEPEINHETKPKKQI